VNNSPTLNNSFRRSGILFVLSAPSGAGKTTLTSGEDYRFLDEEEFQHRASRGEFLEYACVHGNFYGTLKAQILECLQRGVDALIDIDIKGAAMIRACGDPLVAAALADVFIMPPCLEELERRLKKRGTESPAQIQIATRLANAAAEMEHWRDYRYTIISGSMEEDIEKFRAVMRAERYLSRRLIPPVP